MGLVLFNSYQRIYSLQLLYLTVLAAETEKSLKINSFKSLPSYDDINFRLDTNEGPFLLKVFHGMISKLKVRLEEQVQFQYFLKENGIMVPGIRKDKAGRLQSYRPMKVSNGETMECAVRLLEYIPGQIAQKLPLYNKFFHEIGMIVLKL